jgi:hypothetical protein
MQSRYVGQVDLGRLCLPALLIGIRERIEQEEEE